VSVKPSALDVYSALTASMLSGVHTCMPAEVMRVHEGGTHKRQFVDVLPSLQRQARDEDGVLIDEVLPIVTMVPVGYMQGGGFFISVPLAIGDIVLLVFAERSLDHWIETARKRSQRAVIPGDVGTHTLEGAIALPCGPAPRADLLEGVDAADLVIARQGGPELRVTPGGIVKVVGNLEVTGSIKAAGEVYGKAGTPGERALTTHTHNTAMGPSGPPNPAP
jgi:hypothetical protein